MLEKKMVTIRDFFLSLATVLDVAEPNLSKHQLRTAYIAWQIGANYGLTSSELSDLIVASLIHDIGALSLEEKVNLHSSVYEDLELHSIRGWYIVNKIKGFEKIANAIKFHHTAYMKLDGKEVLAQIINIADTVERAVNRSKEILTQREDICRILKAESGNLFNPTIINTFNQLAQIDGFWFDLVNPNLRDFFYESPLSTNIIDTSLTIQLSLLVRDIIDFKSPFTVRHSTSVMIVATKLAKLFSLSKTEVNNIKIAALLHDIGKLTIPTSIIMKPGPLDTIERSIIKKHPYYTYVFLKSAHYPQSICEAASFHHETINGRGYPFAINKDSLTLADRIITISDIFVALTEDRPYRKGLEREKVNEILGNYVKDTLDEKIYKKVDSVYDALLDEISTSNKYLESEYNTLMNLKV